LPTLRVGERVNDDQPYQFEIGIAPLVSLPYSVQTKRRPCLF
jgi:hypothetical protein